MKNNTKKRKRLKKKIREAIRVILIGTAGAAILVGLWIGSVIQTSERISETIVEGQR